MDGCNENILYQNDKKIIRIWMGVMKIYSTKTIKNRQNMDGRNENI